MSGVRQVDLCRSLLTSCCLKCESRGIFDYWRLATNPSGTNSSFWLLNSAESQIYRESGELTHVELPTSEQDRIRPGAKPS